MTLSKMQLELAALAGQQSVDQAQMKRLVRGGQVPILARSGLYLTLIQGNGKRFARLFADTWRGLPLTVRRKLRAHWRLLGGGFGGGGEFIPIIVLVENRQDYEAVEEQAFGACYVFGLTLLFNALYVDRFPDDEVKYVIAHELAHVYCYATARRMHMRNIGEDQSLQWLHREVGEVLSSWGYDQEKNVRTVRRLGRKVDAERARRIGGD